MPSVEPISFLRLVIALMPVVVALVICLYWKMDIKGYVYATCRMLVQLLGIGFVLLIIFKEKNPWIILGVIVVMFTVATWIALGSIAEKRKQFFWQALISLVTGGGSTLALVIFGVVNLDPWYEPHYVIPLAGMIFANSMNALSLAAERFESERGRNVVVETASKIAFKTAMLPITNSFLATGLVALPGMMTGQILSGVSPIIAARYQIVIMSLLFGASGITTFLYLQLINRRNPGTI